MSWRVRFGRYVDLCLTRMNFGRPPAAMRLSMPTLRTHQSLPSLRGREGTEDMPGMAPDTVPLPLFGCFRRCFGDDVNTFGAVLDSPQRTVNRPF
jgi:hypothetical protein